MKCTTADDLDTLLAAACRAGDLPGIVALAANDCGLLYQGAHGVLEWGKPAPMRIDTTFRIHSMTKTVTGVAAMQLVEQGRIDLDAPLAPILPALRDKQVLDGFDDQDRPILRPARRAITLRHLLTHTAGFGYDIWNADLRRYFKVTGAPGPFAGTLASLDAPLTFDPGTRWQYSIGIDLAGRVIEEISGLDLETYFRRHIFEPLGMNETGFQQDEALRTRRVTMHRRGADGRPEPIILDRPESPEFFGGGGGLFGTMPDFLRFTRCLLAGGAPLLKPATMALMRENHIGGLKVEPMRTVMPNLSQDADFFPGMENVWGLTFLVNTEDTPQGRAAGSMAWAGLSNLYFWIDPTRQITGVFGAQMLPFFDARAIATFRAFETAVYGMLRP